MKNIITVIIFIYNVTSHFSYRSISVMRKRNRIQTSHAYIRSDADGITFEFRGPNVRAKHLMKVSDSFDFEAENNNDKDDNKESTSLLSVSNNAISMSKDEEISREIYETKQEIKLIKVKITAVEDKITAVELEIQDAIIEKKPREEIEKLRSLENTLRTDKVSLQNLQVTLQNLLIKYEDKIASTVSKIGIVNLKLTFQEFESEVTLPSGEIFKGSFLDFGDIPEIFFERYDFPKTTMFIRECYKELYDIMTANMITFPKNSLKILLTGVPGIGKSYSLIYFIYRYLNDDRFPDKRFALEFASGEYHYFNPISGDSKERFNYEYSKRNVDSIPLKDILLLSDMKTLEEPLHIRAKYLIIFSSPDPRRYKETMKYGKRFQYTMPVWNESEISIAAPIPREKWYDTYEKVGGVPRLVFETDINYVSSRIELSLKAKGGAVADQVFSVGMGGIDIEKSYMITHVNPINENGIWNYASFIYTFASDYMFLRIMSLEDKKIRRNVVGLLNSGRAIDEWGPTLTGLLLERILSTLIPIDGMDLVLTSLETGETLNVVLPKTSKFISNKDLKEIISSTNQLDKLQANVLYKDLKGNFESFDLFCVVEDPENATKYIMLGLQVTTSNTHPVKYNGVKNMFNAFPDDIKKNLSKPIIAFVTLPKGTLKSKQPIHDKDKKVVKEITAPVNLFRQYVCRYKISK